MKRLLLDTHVLLWWLSDDRRLGASAREVIADGRNEVFVSAVTTWEISIKRSLGKLTAPDNMDAVVEHAGFGKLPVSLFHGDQAGRLPDIHRDPFDRMLVAQAQAEGLDLVTSDNYIPQYGVKVLAASD